MPRVGVALGGASPCQGFLQSVVGQESLWSDACQSGLNMALLQGYVQLDPWFSKVDGECYHCLLQVSGYLG